ncbi:MAG: hypothetical protein F6J98_26210, partial [Moorea sp. SIO4G2]|nr:hypothetical protein [Moorena sp. SIO4G2]
TINAHNQTHSFPQRRSSDSLGGQVRLVSQMELRLKEAAKLGFKRAIIPKGQTLSDLGIEIIQVSRVLDAIIAALPGGLRQDFPEDIEDQM